MWNKQKMFAVFKNTECAVNYTFIFSLIITLDNLKPHSIVDENKKIFQQSTKLQHSPSKHKIQLNNEQTVYTNITDIRNRNRTTVITYFLYAETNKKKQKPLTKFHFLLTTNMMCAVEFSNASVY